jgi:chromosome segregation ATPase
MYQHIHALQTQVRALNDELTQLGNINDALDLAHAEKDNVNDELHDRIVELEQTIATLEDTIDTRNDEAEILRGQIASLRDMVHMRDADNTQLRRDLHHAMVLRTVRITAMGRIGLEPDVRRTRGRRVG